MTFREKQEYLHRIRDSETIEMDNIQKRNVEQMSYDKSPIIRGEVAITLAFFNNEFAENILTRLATDSNTLVRVEAVDSFSSINTKNAYDILLKSIIDPYYLVRGYSVYSLSLVGKAINVDTNIIVSILNNLIGVEKNLFVKLNCYHALYILGCRQLEKIFGIFKSKNYRNRCAVVNVLDDILTEKNAYAIKKFLTKAVSEESTESVLTSLNKILRKIRALQDEQDN